MTAAIASRIPLPMASPDLAVEVIGDFGELLRVQPQWRELLEASGIEHPFLTPEWLLSWWECFGAGRRLRVVLVRRAGRLVGFAPLMLGREWRYGLPVRRLGSLYNHHVPRSGWIVAPQAHGVVEAIWQQLRDARRDWDVLELCQLDDGPGNPAPLRALAEADGFLTGRWRARPSPYLPIKGSWDEYGRSLQAKHRSNLRNRRKRLGQLGEVALEVVTGAEPGALEDGLRIEAAAWKQQAGTAIASRPELRRFYTRLAERLGPRDGLRLQFLTVGGRRIAFGFSLCHRNRLYLLKPGYDPEYARYAPGSLLTESVLHQAFDQGLLEHDFLGVDDAWKREWTPWARPHHWLHVFAPAPRGALLHALKFRLLPLLRGGIE